MAGAPGVPPAQVTEALLSEGAAVNAIREDDSCTPLHLAANHGRLKALASAPYLIACPQFSRLVSSAFLTAQMERVSWSELHQKLLTPCVGNRASKVCRIDGVMLSTRLLPRASQR